MSSSSNLPPVSPELSVVVPTFNESENISELVLRLGQTLVDVAWEVIFVDDDSPDNTAQIIKELAVHDPHVRCLRRVGRRGLAGACIEGILSSAAPTVAVMDADLQHDETLLPKMYAAICSGDELAIGSRYVDGGSSACGLSSIRQWGSHLATTLAKKFLRVDISDPMSGFFMLRREIVEQAADNLSNDGFKILLDIIASTPRRLKTVEVPFTFRERFAGESKLDTLVTVEYLGLLFSKISGGVIPIRFLMFLAVGASGIIIHLVVLLASLHGLSLTFSWSQFTAAFVAMTWNFILNNQLTYRDRRLKGLAFIKGLISFYVVCSLGMLANVGAATWLYGLKPNQIFAGAAGAIIGSVFNYAASSVLTWRVRQNRRRSIFSKYGNV